MKKRKTIWLILIGTVLMLAGAIIVGKIHNQKISAQKALVFLGEIEINHRGGAVYAKLNSELVQYWDGSLYLYDKTGKKKWSTYIGALNPEIKTGGENIYLLDKGNNQVLCIDIKGEIVYRYSLEEALVNFEICRDDYLILQYSPKNSITNIKVLDKKGSQYSDILLTEGEVINISISKAYDYIGINTLTIKDSLESHLLIYDTKGQLMVSKNLGEELVLGFLYDLRGNMIVIKENGVFAINKNNNTVWDENLDKVKLYSGDSSQNIVFYKGPVGGNQFIHGRKSEDIKILKNNGKLLARAGLDELVTGLDLYEDTIVFYSPRTIYLLGKKGNVEMIHKYSSDIEKVFVLSNKHLAIVTKEKLSFVKTNEG